MSTALQITLFIFGAAIGSFINVLGLRYSAKAGFEKAMKGRSKCPHCKKTLKWFELLPVVSFIVQGGKCRGCGKHIVAQYLLVELIAGLIPVLALMAASSIQAGIIWTVVLWTLLLISLIDLRLKIIPNRLVLLLGSLGVINIAWVAYTDKMHTAAISTGTFMGHYALLFGTGNNIVFGYLGAVAFSLLLFGGINYVSKGKAMGMGDVKLAAVMGLLLMLPDMVLATIIAFLTGSAMGIFMMARRGMKLKSSIPFGPFIALGVTLAFFFGYDIVNAYFNAFGLI